MTYRGVLKNGVIILDDPTGIDEGEAVEVHTLRTAESPAFPSKDQPTQNRPIAAAPQMQPLLDIAGILNTGRTDGARNHDHYITGAPKREADE